MSTISQELWWTRREAAAYTRVSEATIGREVRNGRLRHARVGGRRALRFRREWLDDWLATAQPVEEPMFASTLCDPMSQPSPRFIRTIRASNTP